MMHKREVSLQAHTNEPHPMLYAQIANQKAKGANEQVVVDGQATHSEQPHHQASGQECARGRSANVP